MSEYIKFLGDLELAGAMSFAKNYSDFPTNPAPRTVVVKEGTPYIYTELQNGSGYFTWTPIGIKHASYLHTQGVASTVWTVTHNFNSSDFGYFVYDDNHKLVMANTTIVDVNTCQVNLSEAMTGTAVFFSLQMMNATTLAATAQVNVGTGVITSTGGKLLLNGNELAFAGAVTTAVSAEEARAIAAESALGTRIDNVLTNTDPAALDSLSELVAAYQSVDSDLNAAIAAMGTSATSALAGVQTDIGNLATVAHSGLYSDLSGKPTTLAGYGITDALEYNPELISFADAASSNTSIGFASRTHVQLDPSTLVLSDTFETSTPTPSSIGVNASRTSNLTNSNYISGTASLHVVPGTTVTYTGFSLPITSSYEISFWMRPVSLGVLPASGTYNPFCFFAGNCALVINASRNLEIIESVVGSTSSNTVNVGEWNHISIAVSGNIAKTFINGELSSRVCNFAQGIYDFNANRYLFNTLQFKSSLQHAAEFYIDNVTVTNTVRHTQNFVPVTSEDYYAWEFIDGLSYNTLTDVPVIPTVPTLVSSFTNDIDYQTGSQVSSAISDETTRAMLAEADIIASLNTQNGAISSSSTDLATEVARAIAAETQLTTDIIAEVTRATAAETTLQSNIDNIGNNLATVATSGSYTDLSNKPTALSSFTNDSGFQTSAQVNTAIQAVVGAAPAALDTLEEIAAQLANDQSAAAALTTVVSGKVTANAAITAGTGTKVTYDAKGLVTSSTTLSASDIPALSYAALTGATFTGTVTAPNFDTNSDRTLKDNIVKIESAMDVIAQLDGVSYTWKENGQKTYGFIAQEIEQIIPELVGTNAELGTKTVNYQGIIPFLVEALKEQSAKIAALEAQLNK